MGTPLYSTNIKTVPNRPELSALDAGDFYLVYDTSTGKISKISKTNAHAELVASIGANADDILLRENLSNKKSTLAENSEVYYPNQKAVNDGLATKITRPTSTDKAIPRFSGTSGDLQNSGVTIDDSGNITPTGIFLGGASSANYLDDYEEGTFTGGISDGTNDVIYSNQRYTKIGNVVTISLGAWRLDLSAFGTGVLRYINLPFMPLRETAIAVMVDNTNKDPIFAFLVDNCNTANLQRSALGIGLYKNDLANANAVNIYSSFSYVCV